MAYYSQNNKAGKHLSSQLKQWHAKAKISSLQHHASGKIFHTPQEIAEAFGDYYKSLYNLKEDFDMPQPTKEIIVEFLRSINLSSVDESTLSILNHPITASEVLTVVKSLTLNRPPGADGFSAEYYKAFSDVLTPCLTRVFNDAAASGTFPKEMLQAVIVTLPKQGKNPTLPQNFRPIPFLNSDLKIYAKRLACRLLEVTPYLIGLGQVGFIKGCQAPDGIRRMSNLIKYAEKSRNPPC